MLLPEAALTPWWNLAEPPVEVLILRATLRQRRHEFDSALADLTAALQRLKTDLPVGDDLQRIFDDAAKWKRTLDESEFGGRGES